MSHSGGVERFASAIPFKTVQGMDRVHGLCFRALVRALLGSATQLGSTLARNTDDGHFPTNGVKRQIDTFDSVMHMGVVDC